MQGDTKLVAAEKRGAVEQVSGRKTVSEAGWTSCHGGLYVEIRQARCNIIGRYIQERKVYYKEKAEGKMSGVVW